MILPDVVATGLLAALAGLAAVPSTRRLVLGEIGADWLADELELDRIEPDGCTVRCKSGVFTQVWSIGGTAFDARPEAEQTALLTQRASFLQQAAKGGRVHLRLLAVKRRRSMDIRAAWPGPTLTTIGDAEAARYTASHAIEWFLMISARSMQPLLDLGQLVVSTLDHCDPALLSTPEDPALPCPLTGFLNGLVCGEYRPDLLPVSASLSGRLPASDMAFDSSGLIRTECTERAFHRILAVREWPETVSGRLIADLLSLDGDVEISQIAEPFDTDQALLMFKRQQNSQGANVFFPNPSAMAETDFILENLSSGALALFATQFQVILRAGDEATLDHLLDRARAVLGARRVLFSVESRGAPACWFGRLPSAPMPRRLPGSRLYRPLTLREENLAALWPFMKSPGGMETSPFGPAPVRVFPTTVGQAYRFHFHVSPKEKSLGHFLLFAPSSGGKSTLMMHLLGGLAKYDRVRSFILDSKEGARFMIEAMGGLYQTYDRIALNPLDVGADTPRNREQVWRMLRAMAGPAALEPADQTVIQAAVNLVFQLDPPQRTLNDIFPHAWRAGSRLQGRMAPWVTDPKGNIGPYAHIFNAPHDSLGGLLDHYMVGINMNEALDNPELGPPVVGHIASAIGRSAAETARGFVIFIDEAAKLLQNPGFESLAVEMYREYRKLGGVVGMAFQDPAALLASSHAAAFIENAASLIFLPNANAKPETLAPFNLNDEHIAFITGQTVTPGKRQALLVRREAASGFAESVILDIDLSWLGDGMRFYRSGPDVNAHLDSLKTTWGNAWPDHI